MTTQKDRSRHGIGTTPWRMAAAAWLLCAVFLSASSETVAGPRESADQQVQSGMQLLQSPSPGKVAQARELFRGALRDAPNHEGAHLGLVYAGLLANYLRQPDGDPAALAEAVTHADAVLAANPASEDAWYKKSQALFFLGQTDKGLETIRAGVKSLPHSAVLREGLVVLLLRAGRTGEAVIASKDALAQAGTDADLQVRLGRVWLDADRPALAREHFALAAQVQPSRASALGLAAAYGAEASYGEAIGMLETWLVAHPDDAEALRDLALRCEEAGELVKARIAWTKLRVGAADPKLRELAGQRLEELKRRPAQQADPNSGA